MLGGFDLRSGVDVRHGCWRAGGGEVLGSGDMSKRGSLWPAIYIPPRSRSYFGMCRGSGIRYVGCFFLVTHLDSDPISPFSATVL